MHKIFFQQNLIQKASRKQLDFKNNKQGAGFRDYINFNILLDMGLGYHQRTGLDLGPGGACEQIPGNVHINHIIS